MFDLSNLCLRCMAPLLSWGGRRREGAASSPLGPDSLQLPRQLPKGTSVGPLGLACLQLGEGLPCTGDPRAIGRPGGFKGPADS